MFGESVEETIAFLESAFYRVKGIPDLFDAASLANQKKIPNINSRFIDECESVRDHLDEVVQIGEQAGHPMRKTELLFMAMGGEGDPTDELIRETLVEVAVVLRHFERKQRTEATQETTSETGPIEPLSNEIALTAPQRRLLNVMMQHERRMTFNELRKAWDKDVQEDAIIKALKRLRPKLPRSQWDFEISEANWEVIWHKKGQSVP